MKKDLRIYKMKDLLRKKRKYMFDKEKEIRDIMEHNSFLETVVNDYENYNNIILDEKRKQKRALKVLSDHIREISRNIKNDEFKLNRVKMDQTELLREIQNIRDEIEYVLRTRGNNDRYVSSDDDDDNDNDDGGDEYQ
jgi:chromosome segregation ATPase